MTIIVAGRYRKRRKGSIPRACNGTRVLVRAATPVAPTAYQLHTSYIPACLVKIYFEGVEAWVKETSLEYAATPQCPHAWNQFGTTVVGVPFWAALFSKRITGSKVGNAFEMLSKPSQKRNQNPNQN